MKRPAQLAGSHVEGANIPRRRGKGFRIAPADDQQVFINSSRAGQVNRLRRGGLATEIFAQVDPAVAPETRDGPAGDRIQRIDKVHDSDQNSLVLAIGPVRKSAVWLGPFDARVKLPEQFAGRGIEGEDFLRRCDPVEHALGHNRAGLQAAFFLGIEAPRLPPAALHYCG